MSSPSNASSPLSNAQLDQIESHFTAKFVREPPAWLDKRLKGYASKHVWGVAGAILLIAGGWLFAALNGVENVAAKAAKTAAATAAQERMDTWLLERRSVIDAIQKDARECESYRSMTAARLIKATEHSTLAKERADAVVKTADRLSEAKVRDILKAADELTAQSDGLVQRVAALVKVDVKSTSELLPIGTVIGLPYAPNEQTLLDRGWMICKGQSLPVAGHETLAKLLRAAYGVAKDSQGRILSDHVKLPDFQGMFLRGHGGADSHRSNPIGEQQPDAVKSHIHGGVIRAPKAKFQKTSMGDVQREASHADSALGQSGKNYTNPNEPSALETRPVNYAVYWIVRVK